MAKLLILFLFLPSLLFAQDDLVDPGKIEVNYSAARMLPYKQRRENWSWMVGFNVEQLYFPKYRSELDGYSYEQLFGSSTLNLLQISFGAKYNFSVGSLGAGIVTGQGHVQDGRVQQLARDETTDPDLVTDAELEITKIGAYASIVLDTIFDEPYVAPYIEGQIFRFGWVESSLNTSETPRGWTNYAFAFTVGGLFQLNWLDPDASFQAQESSGLDNLFLDLFVSFYSDSGGDNDQGFASSDNYGAGLKFEF